MVAKLRTTSGTKIPFTGSLINRRDWRGKTVMGKEPSTSDKERGARDVQNSCKVNVEVFKRNNAMLRKKNICSTTKVACERFLTPERVT